MLWADTHHPALSETGGDYDGQFVFINDKANARVAVIDLRDFETKQIVKNPIAINDHGGTFVTPDTELDHRGRSIRHAARLGVCADLGVRERVPGHGHVLEVRPCQRAGSSKIQSFAMELPPYWQDLCDAGKLVSDGWIFCNSFNTEMATGSGDGGSGGEPFEAGASARDKDYMHVINLDKPRSRSHRAAIRSGERVPRHPARDLDR